MARNNELGAAKTAKKDEFYTQLTDIEKEMRYYRKHFKGKTVLCNCDDPCLDLYKNTPSVFEQAMKSREKMAFILDMAHARLQLSELFC